MSAWSAGLKYRVWIGGKWMSCMNTINGGYPHCIMTGGHKRLEKEDLAKKLLQIPQGVCYN